MKKYFLLIISPILFSSMIVNSTEQSLPLSNQEKYRLNFKEYQGYFQTIPSNPNLFIATYTYKDKNLKDVYQTLQPNTPFIIKKIMINDANQPVFQLGDSSYILADSRLLFDDKVVTEKSVHQTYWLKKGFVVYSSPISNESKQQSTTLQAYQPVTVSKLVETPIHTFAKVAEDMWILLDDLSETDNRMVAVQTLLEKKYSSDKLSIYVKQLSTGKTAGIHEESKMYAASISKLPILYYAQQMIDQGSYQLTDSLHYIQEVTIFKGSYSPEGSGELSKTADGQQYSIRDLIDKIAKLSDNAASNLLAYYVTKQFDEEFYQTITDITGERWDMQNRLASSKMAGLMMEALYNQGGYALESLKSTNFDNQRIPRDISVTIAHKIGDAYDVKHDVAVVYAKDPFILSIFTDQSDYDTISAIANDIYEILK